MPTIAEFVFDLAFGKADTKNLDDAERAGREAYEGIQDEIDATARADAAARAKMAAGWRDQARALGSAFRGIATGILGAGAGVLAFVDNQTAAADATAKSARAAGQSAETYQRLAFAAEHGGASVEQLSAGYRFLNKQLQDVSAGGGKAMVDALTSIGLSVGDLQGQDAEAQLGMIGDALNGVADPAQRVATLSKLLGEEAGPKLASTLEAGTVGLKELGDRAQSLGAVLSDEALTSAEAFQDQLTDTKAEIGAFTRAIAVDLLPAAREIFGVFSEVVRWFASSENAAVRATPAIVALGAAVYALAGPWGLVAAGIALVVANLSTMQNAVTDVLGVLTGLNDELERMNGLSGGQSKLTGSLGILEGKGEFAYGPHGKESVRAAEYRRELAGLSDSDLATFARNARNDKVRRDAQAQLDERKTIGKINAANAAMVAGAEGLAARGAPAAVGGGKKGGRKASTPEEIVIDGFDVDELFGSEVRRLAEREGLGEIVIQASLEAAAESLRRGDTEGVARNAALSRLGSSAGKDLTIRGSDPPMSELLGHDVPDVELSSIARGAEPQVLISNIYNTFTNDIDINVDGVGDPGAVADRVSDVFDTKFEQLVSAATKTAKVAFAR